MPPLDSYCKVSEAATLLGVHPETIKRLCQRGRLPAEKVHNTWLIQKEKLEKFAATYRNPRRVNAGTSAVSLKQDSMVRRRACSDGENSNHVRDYRYDATRKNNPEAGLVTYLRERPERKRYEYDPHLDPQLIWAGKAERLSFEVDTVPLHIHERVSSRAILRAVERQEKQLSLFADPQLSLDQRIEFYQHDVNWANRLILGDSLLVMNSLLEREFMGGKVQMIYVDPPYGVSYSSNFQPTIRQRDVKDGQDESLTREPEQIKAYRDTWTLGIHSYLTYLRDRLLLCRELLHESGSIFVQISDENLHLVRALMDEVFGRDNFVATIVFRKTGGLAAKTIAMVCDYLLWYAKLRDQVKYRQLYIVRPAETVERYEHIEMADGTIRKLTREELQGAPLPQGARRIAIDSLSSPGVSATGSLPFEFQGQKFLPTPGCHWKTTHEGLQRLAEAGRLHIKGKNLFYKRYLDDFPLVELHNNWEDTQIGGFARQQEKIFVVQTATKVLERCILMTTDPGDLVFDPTCGSGTTAYVAEQWGRRWITCDTSRVALALARQRLMTATFPYYQLAYPEQGVSAGFVYETVPHITLKSIAQNEPPQEETLYDKPKIDRGKVRVSGPFTVEAIPIPTVEEPDQAIVPAHEGEGSVSDPGGDHIARMIELLRKDGVTFPGNRKLILQNLRPVDIGMVHAEAEAEEGSKPVRVAVSFGPPHGPITSRQVEEAMRAAQWEYQLLIFAGFSFDPEAQAFVQKNPHPRLKTQLAYISPDVLVGDLLKTTQTSQLFTVFGQPDIKVSKQKDETYTVELLGVDIYDPTTGEVQSASGQDIAAWFLDQDYDNHSFYICQAFFPGGTNPWEKLQRALRGVVDQEKFESLQGTVSLPFKAGKHRRIAVKVIDLRGNEVIRVMALEDEFKGEVV